ncbi:hypothetical protein BC828DRAFT_146571 [Blastocladiella britannica]|nr:hypothetical protein BC828DRAFT_146571 [Blastocladiella britannica]
MTGHGCRCIFSPNVPLFLLLLLYFRRSRRSLGLVAVRKHEPVQRLLRKAAVGQARVHRENQTNERLGHRSVRLAHVHGLTQERVRAAERLSDFLGQACSARQVVG